MMNWKEESVIVNQGARKRPFFMPFLMKREKPTNMIVEESVFISAVYENK